MAVGEVSNGLSHTSFVVPAIRPLSVVEFKDAIIEQQTQPPVLELADLRNSLCEPPHLIAHESRPNGLAMYFQFSEYDLEENSNCEDEVLDAHEENNEEQERTGSESGLILYFEDEGPSTSLLADGADKVDVSVRPQSLDNVIDTALESEHTGEDCESIHSSDSDPELIVGAAEAATAAERVRTMAAETMKDAWDNLRQEFEVQVLIWNNMLSMGAAGFNVRANRKAHETMCALIKEGMELAESEVSGGVCDKSRQKLETVLARDADYGGLLNHSTKAMISTVLKAQDIMMSRLELASSLDVATSAQAEAVTEQNHLHLGALIELCDLGDLGLIYRVRRVLGLSMGWLIDASLEEEHDVDEGTVTPPHELEIDPWAVGGSLDTTWGQRRGWRHYVSKQRSRSSSRGSRSKSSIGSKSSSSRSGRSVGSHGSSRSSRSRKNDTVLESGLFAVPESGFPAIVRTSMSGERHHRHAAHTNTCKGTPAHGMETGVLGMPGPPDVAPWITEVVNTPLNVQASAAAEKVRNLALEGLEGIWDEARQEFEVQMLVWSSLALVHGSSGPNAKAIRAFAAALEASDNSALEDLIQQHSGSMSKSTLATMKNVVEAENLAKLRRELANSLEAAGRAGFAGDIWEPGPELENRIKSCQLKDLGIEYSVRRVLGLSIGGDFRDRWKKYRHVSKGKLPKGSPGYLRLVNT